MGTLSRVRRPRRPRRRRPFLGEPALQVLLTAVQTRKSPTACRAFLSRTAVHGFPVIEVEPPFYHPVDEPNVVRREDQEADANHQEQSADNAPEQAEPESADLPAKVAFDPGSPRFILLHVVDHDGGYPCDADKKPDRLQDVHEGCRAFGRGFVRAAHLHYRFLSHARLLVGRRHKPSSRHNASTRCFTSSLIAIGVPQRRSVSPGHLLVASIPSLEPSPGAGLAKSR